MAESLLSPINDVVFKMLMGDPTRPALIAAFLPEVAPDLPRDELLKVSFVDPQQRGDAPEDKLGILDVLVELPSGEQVNVEVQLQPHRWIRERLLFYAARMMIGPLKAGDDYKKMSRSICILIADHQVFPQNNRWHHRFRLYDPAAKAEFSNKLEIHTLELPKLPPTPEGSDTSALWGWMRFLSARTKEDYQMAIKEAPVLEQAYNRLVELSADESARMLADAREKARRDASAVKESAYLDGREEGLEEGLEKGREEGRVEERAELFRLMRGQGMPVEDIARFTGVSVKEVNRILER